MDGKPEPRSRQEQIAYMEGYVAGQKYVRRCVQSLIDRITTLPTLYEHQIDEYYKRINHG